jgi:phosphatidate cytidylyltransferase
MLKRIDPNQAGDTVVLVLLVAWFADTGAYFAGRFLGNAKLYPAVSPKKTWAGAWGGLAGSVLGVTVLKLITAHWLTWVDVFAIAIPGGVLGQLGDLAESLIKRSVGVKDSGTLLPGHGGILDRIDAVIFIAPYVYCYLVIKFTI